jgi:hypothetical protein
MTWGLSCWTRFEIISRWWASAAVGDDIVDLHGAECAGAASQYCGTGICEFVVLVAKRDDSLVTVFSTAATLGNPSCRASIASPGKPFAFKQPK